jgi:hypothetical protein
MEILRVVASGGFGIVYLARDHSLDRDVAVKEFMPSLLVDRGSGDHVTVRSTSNLETFAVGLQSFVAEARLLARFSHPAVVKVYRFWEANGTAYMAMPYLRGPTLRDVRRSMSEPPTEGWLRLIIDPLLDALAVLHSEGFYHRDISPDNVIVSDAGLPVLLDFGSARHLIADRTQSLTAVLKPQYAPIEQYAESSRLRQGPWTDIYALGAVVAYLLDGSAPPASTARSIHDEMRVLAARHIPGVSIEFLSAIDWALAVRPQDRPQDVAQLRHALNGRPVTPLRECASETSTQGEADHELTADGAGRFPATVHWSRPVALPRRLAVLSLIAGTSVAVAALVAWPLGRQTSLDTASLGPELTAKPSTPPMALALVSVGTAQVISIPSPRAPTAAPAPDASSTHDLSSRAARPRRTEGAPKARELGRKAWASSGRSTTQSPAFTKGQVMSPGPIEICAGRSFFVRPFCIQRRCDEPRFKAHAECLQLQQVARARQD